MWSSHLRPARSGNAYRLTSRRDNPRAANRILEDTGVAHPLAAGRTLGKATCTGRRGCDIHDMRGIGLPAIPAGWPRLKRHQNRAFRARNHRVIGIKRPPTDNHGLVPDISMGCTCGMADTTGAPPGPR